MAYRTGVTWLLRFTSPARSRATALSGGEGRELRTGQADAWLEIEDDRWALRPEGDRRTPSSDDVGRMDLPDPAGADHVVVVRGDLMALPFRRGAISGARVSGWYRRVPATALPAALAQLHHVMPDDARVLLVRENAMAGDAAPAQSTAAPNGAACDLLHVDTAGSLSGAPFEDIVTGAGFRIDDSDRDESTHDLRLRRVATIPDTVGPGMRVLVCGLNPSLHAVDRGVGYAGRGNRFWPAAMAGAIVGRSHDPFAALRDGVGMTDLVKRPTPRAAAVRLREFREGAERVERLVRWLRPRVVCFVGLVGYRAARDRKTVAGWQPQRFGGVRTYVMPSTSGLNTHATFDDIVAHLAEVAAAAA